MADIDGHNSFDGQKMVTVSTKDKKLFSKITKETTYSIAFENYPDGKPAKTTVEIVNYMKPHNKHLSEMPIPKRTHVLFDDLPDEIKEKFEFEYRRIKEEIEYPDGRPYHEIS